MSPLLKVEVVREGSSLLGPILVAAGAVVAAILTALTANWRHRKQLEHDRELRNRDHIRDTLDSALNGLTRVVKLTTDLAAEVLKLEDKRSRGEVRDEDLAQAKAAGKTAFEAIRKVRANNARLQLRLLDQDPIVKHHDSTRLLFAEWQQFLVQGLASNRTAEQKTAAESKLKEIGPAFTRFRHSCQQWFGAQPSTGL